MNEPCCGGGRLGGIPFPQGRQSCAPMEWPKKDPIEDVRCRFAFRRCGEDGTARALFHPWLEKGLLRRCGGGRRHGGYPSDVFSQASGPLLRLQISRSTAERCTGTAWRLQPDLQLPSLSSKC